MVHYIILEAFKQRKFPNTAVTNSYAEGSITINANNFTSGQVFAGGLFGMCACGVEKSSAKVSIQVKTENPSAITQLDNGALGGLIGIWTPWKNSNLSFCTAWADIESNTTALAGGLVGNMVSLTTYDRSQIMFTEDMLTNPTSEELENMEKLTEFCVAAEMLASIYAYIDMEGTGEYPNTRIENCQVYGSVDAGGSAAGLLGRKELGNQFEWTMKKNRASTDKVAKLFIPMEFGSFAVIETQKEKQPNLDIVECYVDVNVTTTGDYAAGIIATKAGGTKESKIEAEWGYVSKCYVHGNIAAGKVAAGVVAHEDETGDDHDYSRDCTAILYTIVACKSISANKVDSVKDTAVYPLWNIETMYSFGGELETLYYYDTIAYKRKQSGTVYTSASNIEYQGVAKTKTELNKTQTYLELWDPCFCNVSGLDYDKGFLPIVLEERCFFNTEDAKIYYHVGDAFEPITKGTLYTGNGSTTITTEDGLTSTEPDMTKPGIQKVTVSYKEQKKDYKIYVYPVTESYIKVTEKPTLEQNGDEYTLSGGKIGVYLSNGTLSRTVDFNECGVEYKEGYASITYEGMNTSMKILTLESYANKGVDEDELVKLGTWYYLSGDTVVASEIVEQKRKVSDQGQQRELNLLASSLSEDVTITSDMYVLSLYQKVGDEKPQPTPTPTPIPTKEPGNTPTPVPTKEPGNTPTPTPTITPVPTKTPVVTSTAKPTPGSGNTPVTSPTVSKKNAPVISMKKTVGKGAKIKLALAKDLGGVKVTYKTSNKKVATVSKKGVVSAKKKGSATITQTVTYRGGMYLVKLKLKVQAKKAKGKLYQPSIKVIKKGIPVTYMGATLKKGKTTAIRVKKGDSVTKVTYTTSNKKVATVSKTGKIKAKKKGKVKIIAKIKQGEHTYYSVMTVKVVN